MWPSDTVTQMVPHFQRGAHGQHIVEIEVSVRGRFEFSIA